MMNELTDLVNVDLNQALDLFVRNILNAAEIFKKTQIKTNKSEGFYTRSCQLAKREARRALRRFRNFKLLSSKRNYCVLRNKYKTECRKAKHMYERKKCNILKSALHKSSVFWKELGRLNHAQNANCPVDKLVLYSHFKELFKLSISR